MTKIILPSELVRQGFVKKFNPSNREFFQKNEELYLFDQEGCGYLSKSDLGDVNALGFVEVQCGACKQTRFGFKIQ